MIGLVHTCGTGEEEDAIGEDEDDSTDGSEAGGIGRMA